MQLDLFPNTINRLGIKAELVDHMGDDLRVVNAARVSFDKESTLLLKMDGQVVDGPCYDELELRPSDSHAQKEIQELAHQWDTIIRPLFPISWEALTHPKE